MDAHLAWPDGRRVSVPAMSVSDRIKIYDDIEPEIVWKVRKVKTNGNR